MVNPSGGTGAGFRLRLHLIQTIGASVEARVLVLDVFAQLLALIGRQRTRTVILSCPRILKQGLWHFLVIDEHLRVRC